MGLSSSKSTLEHIANEAEKKNINEPPEIRIEDLWKEFPKHEAPKDSEGFIQSFGVDEPENYLQFFKEYGFVVIHNVLSKEVIDKTVDEIWTQLETNKYGWDGSPMIKRDDPATWTDDSWPRAVKHLGILGDSPAIGEMAWTNRLNPNLYKVFSTLIGKKELWVSIDRYGIMRPTKNVPVAKAKEGEEVEKVDQPKWKTASLWLHWDLNPYANPVLGKWVGTQEGIDYEFTGFITENNGSRNDGYPKLQGLVTLTDSREEDGGFCTVPGFHKYLKEWTTLTQDSSYALKKAARLDFVNVPGGDPMFNQVQKITARAGSLIVWSSEQPHCNYPNDSDRFRINQYIKMFPAQEGGPNTNVRADAIKQMLPKNFEPSELGMKLLGLNSWKDT